METHRKEHKRGNDASTKTYLSIKNDVKAVTVESNVEKCTADFRD
jgi:hypothetical protein